MAFLIGIGLGAVVSALVTYVMVTEHYLKKELNIDEKLSNFSL